MTIKNNKWDMNNIGQWITRLLMLFITIIGFFVVRVVTTLETKQDELSGRLSLVGTTVSFSFVVPAYNPPNWPGTGSLSIVTNGSTSGVEIKFADV